VSIKLFLTCTLSLPYAPLKIQLSKTHLVVKIAIFLGGGLQGSESGASEEHQNIHPLFNVIKPRVIT
jgi:hypothetical protein